MLEFKNKEFLNGNVSLLVGSMPHVLFIFFNPVSFWEGREAFASLPSQKPSHLFLSELQSNFICVISTDFQFHGDRIIHSKVIIVIQMLKIRPTCSLRSLDQWMLFIKYLYLFSRKRVLGTIV